MKRNETVGSGKSNGGGKHKVGGEPKWGRYGTRKDIRLRREHVGRGVREVQKNEEEGKKK